MRVFVLLFNARTENEGIHTLKTGDRNIVLMFESEDDATRYALLLEAQDFLAPAVESIDAEDVEDFCDNAHYECKLVPEGTLAVPPESAAEELDWQPEGQTTPDASSSNPGGAAADNADQPNFSQQELDRIRRQLEGLL